MKGRNTDIQCLRAIAIIFVMLQHAWRLPSPPYFSQIYAKLTPWTGVDLFFAISGYLVFKSLMDHVDTKSRKVAFKVFWQKRCARLLPALLFWALISIPIGAWMAPHQYIGALDATKGAVAGIFGIANAYWAYCAHHQASVCASVAYNGQFWSLALEWQLYGLLALFVAIAPLRIVACALAAIGVLASFFPSDSSTYLWDFRPHAFILGALIYFAAREKPSISRIPLGQNIWFVRILLVVGLVMVFRVIKVFGETYTLPLVAVGSAFALIATLCAAPAFPKFMTAPLEWIGERSYSIYLCHLVAMFVVSKIAFSYVGVTNPVPLWTGVSWMAACFFLTCLLSDLSYRYIERPFIARQRVLAL